jgi:hypothetical protein
MMQVQAVNLMPYGIYFYGYKKSDGYFSELSKSVIIVPMRSLDTARAAFADLKFMVVTGSQYLGGFMERRQLLTNGFGRKARVGRKRSAQS